MIFRYIINHFGIPTQLEKTNEEFHEYLHEVKNNGTKRNKYQELADVIIMIIQNMRIFKLNIFVLIGWIIYKLFRTLKRIKSKHYE